MSDRIIGPDADEPTVPQVTGDIHTRSQWSMKVEAIVALLSETEVGQTVTYEALTELTSVQDRDELHSLVGSARKQVLEEPNYVFRAIDNVGYVRLSDAEIATRVPAESRTQMRRRALRTHKELGCVKDFAQLSEDEKKAWNAGMAVNKVVAHALHATVAKKVFAAVDTGKQLANANAFLVSLMTKKAKPE